MRTILLILVISLLVNDQIIAQKNNSVIVDSVFIKLSKLNTPDEKLDFLSTHVSTNRYATNTLTYIKKSEEIAKNASSSDLLAQAYYYYANYYYYNAQLDSSSIYIEKAKNFINDSKHPLLRPSLISTEGGVFKSKGNMPRSIAATLESRTLLEKLDTLQLNAINKARYKRMLLANTNALANYYSENENYPQAIEYYDKGYALSLRDSLFIPAGVFIGNKSDLFIKSDRFQEGLNAALRSKELKLKGGAPERMLSVSDLNIGIAYTGLGYYDQAQNYLDKTITSYENTNNVIRLSEAYLFRGQLFIKKRKFSAAIKDCKRSKELAQKDEILEQITEACYCLFEAYKKQGDMTLALKFYKEHIETRDAIYNERNIKKQTEQELQYEFNKAQEKKDAQLKILELQTEKAQQENKLYAILAILGLFTLSVIGFFLYRIFFKNKLLAKQKILLEATIDEKNTLLKETHHRVKNSFQIVSSLLYLQSENIEDKEAQLAVKEAQNRVRSMVLIHQKLYNKDQLVGINTKEYFQDLTKDILESHQSQEHQITYNLDVTPLILAIETITPIGLILNELITNTLKHAFKNANTDNNLKINFREVDQKLILEVIDNGSGITGEIRDTSFGIKLIKALAKKLKATLHHQPISPSGTKATLTITRFEKLKNIVH